MLRSAVWKLGGALPPTPALAQCGRCRARAMRIMCMVNRYTTALAPSFDDAMYPQDQSTRRALSTSASWSQNEVPSQSATASSDNGAAIGQAVPHGPVPTTNESWSREQRQPEHRSREDYTEMKLFTKVLERRKNHQKWQDRAATSRAVSIPIVLLQVILRDEAVQGTAEGDRLLRLLPSETELQERIGKLARKRRCEPHDIISYAYIIAGKNDNQRCQRFLQHGGRVPIHVLLFILRPTSTLYDIPTLRSLIDLYKSSAEEPTKESQISGYLSPPSYLKISSLLVKHLNRTEPRLLVEAAQAVCCYMKHFVEGGDPRKRYADCCRLFNSALTIFQPKAHLLDKQTPVVNAYYWESQRMLLTLSDAFERPLQVSGAGFRAIRNTLAGMPKNNAERHVALLHAPSWPPYLNPGDGMDEITDPESNWSRAVEAGVLMQEAGFSKTDADESLDILQGLAADGTPTIQQRTLAGGHRKVTVWEATIRATRDAHEAWGRFNDPPFTGAVPGMEEYAAMFEKLTLREAATASRLLPGDKARNFVAYRAANLSDIEWAKARPPSVSELYRKMRDDGLVPSGHCLYILVSNAPDVDTANTYLKDAAELDADIASLTTRTINPTILRGVDMGLFSAYIHMLCRRGDKYGWESLHRAIALVEARLGDKRSRWASLVWGAILKGASRHHSALRMSQPDQVNLIMAIAKRIDRGHRLNLANFVELNRGLRKIIRYDLPALIEQLHRNEVSAGIRSKLPLRVLYETAFAEGTETPLLVEGQDDTRTQPAGGSLKILVDYIKAEFAKFKEHEQSYQAGAHDSHMAPLDRMLSRSDVVRSEHALEYMLTMAYAGEFAEMKRLLVFLMEAWGQADVVAALEALDEAQTPASADLSEVLCVFRLLGEQMLGGLDVAREMQDRIAAAGVGWTWPDVKAVQAYLRTQPHDSIRHVRSVLTQMRAQKKASSGGGGGGDEGRERGWGLRDGEGTVKTTRMDMEN